MPLGHTSAAAAGNPKVSERPLRVNLAPNPPLPSPHRCVCVSLLSNSPLFPTPLCPPPLPNRPSPPPSPSRACILPFLPRHLYPTFFLIVATSPSLHRTQHHVLTSPDPAMAPALPVADAPRRPSSPVSPVLRAPAKRPIPHQAPRPGSPHPRPSPAAVHLDLSSPLEGNPTRPDSPMPARPDSPLPSLPPRTPAPVQTWPSHALPNGTIDASELPTMGDPRPPADDDRFIVSYCSCFPNHRFICFSICLLRHFASVLGLLTPCVAFLRPLPLLSFTTSLLRFRLLRYVCFCSALL